MKLSNGQRLVKMHNPWRKEKYTGDWSDESKLWTDKFKAEAKWTSANDGVFFVPFELYYSQYSVTDFSYDTTHWSSDSFLKLDDNSQA